MAELLDPEQWGRGAQPGPAAGGSTDARAPGPRRTGSAGAPARTGARGTEDDWDPFDEEPSDGGRSSAPPHRTGASSSEPPRSGSRLPLILLIVLLVLALVAGGIWAVASGLLPLGGGSGAAPETPAASAPATDEPQPGATPTTPAEPAGTPLPASCDVLFSDSMRTTIEGDGLVLNPEWSQAEGLRLPTNDAELSALLEPLPRLDCGWLPPGGGSEVGVITSIAQVTPDQQAAVEARFEALGWAQIDELGSVRYVLEEEGAGNRLGQSHIIRDGLWFATGWVNYAPSGYTADMVTQVFG